MPEFFREEVDTEDGECSEYRRPQFERCDVGAKEKDGEGLQVDEESLATVVVGVEELVLARFIGAERIDAVHRLVGIEPGGNVLDIPEPQEKRRREKKNEHGNDHEFFRRKKMSKEIPPHSESILFLS